MSCLMIHFRYGIRNTFKERLWFGVVYCLLFGEVTITAPELLYVFSPFIYVIYQTYCKVVIAPILFGYLKLSHLNFMGLWLSKV